MTRRLWAVSAATCLATALAACYCVAQAAESGAAIPFKPEGTGAGAALQGGALGVLLLSALAIVAVALVRKRLKLGPGGRGAAPRLLQVLETQRLGPRALLSVIEFEGRRYLIAHSEQGVRCLVGGPDAPAPVPAPVPEGRA